MRGIDLTGTFREEWDAVKEEMRIAYKNVPTHPGTFDGGPSEEERAIEEKYWPILRDILRRAEEAENAK